MKKCFYKLKEMILKNQFGKSLSVSVISLILCLFGTILALGFGNLPLTKLFLSLLIVFYITIVILVYDS